MTTVIINVRKVGETKAVMERVRFLYIIEKVNVVWGVCVCVSISSTSSLHNPRHDVGDVVEDVDKRAIRHSSPQWRDVCSEASEGT